MKEKHSPGATKHKFGARTRKYKHGARPENINLGPRMTATARARDCEMPAVYYNLDTIISYRFSKVS